MVDIKDKNGEKPVVEGTYPADYIKIGTEEENFKIFISENTLNDVKAYLSSDKLNELGGVLLGDIYIDNMHNQFIVIDEIVIARFTEANVNRLTFTHKTWENINDKIDKEFPAKRVLGWYHSHPGHTVFLSSYDKFIHENFFNRDFMVAYVFDPINNTEGFFLWKDKMLSKANCFYVYSDFQTGKEKINLLNNDIVIEKKTKDSNISGKIILTLAILSFLLSAVLLIKYFDISNKYSELGDVNGRIKELKDEDIKTNGRIDRLVSALESGSDSSRRNSVSILKYQIKPGETLRKIAVQFYNDEGKYNFLIRYNNLKDENDIAVGQIIEIPLER